MTETSKRPRLIPKTAIIAAVVIVVLLIGAAAGAYLVSRSRLIRTPDVTGLPSDTAKARLRDLGLGFKISGTQVSVDVPVGAVISQSPAPAARLARGSSVTVVISAGPQSFVVPDLIGSPVDGAREVLDALGFTVVIETVSSDTTTPVVLEMFPAPGTSVSVGDEIRLTIPGDGSTSEGLLPYDLKGVLVLLDPAPSPSDLPVDATMEVARRLRSLLEAAGATVTSTRSATGTATSPTERQASAEGSTADVFIGIDIATAGKPGITVLYPAGDARTRESLEYARAITRAATLPSLVVNEPAESSDPVLGVFPRTGVRVVVGDDAVSADRQKFSDPAWADQVARAIYRGVGTALAPE